MHAAAAVGGFAVILLLPGQATSQSGDRPTKPAPSSPAEGGRVRGLVVDRSGSPLPNAHVRTQCQPAVAGGPEASEVSADTDPLGKFQLLGLPRGRTILRAWHPECLGEAELEFDLGEGEQREGVVLELERGSRVAGSVRWPDGSAVSSALVLVHPFPPDDPGRRRSFLTGTAHTDDLGRFDVRGLGPGPYTVQVESFRQAVPSVRPPESFERWTAKIENVQADALDIALQLEPPPPKVDLVGRVIDDLGAPVRKFTIGSKSFDTEDGAFLLSDLDPGFHELSLRAAGYVCPRDARNVSVPADRSPVTIRIVRQAGVTGTVLDATGAPVPRARVTAGPAGWIGPIAWMGSSYDTEADGSGVFELANLPPGPITVLASRGNALGTQPVELWLGAGQHVEGVVLRGFAPGSLTGEVRALDGPAAQWTLHLEPVGYFGKEEQARTDGEGRFSIADLPPGPYRLVAWPPAGGVAGRSARILIRDGENTHVALGGSTEERIRLHGRVTRAGEALPSGSVTAFGGSWPPEVLGGGLVAPDGNYDFWVDGPGDLDLAWWDPSGGREVRYRVSIGAVQEERIDLAIPLGGIRGVVLDHKGEPVAGAAIRILDSSRSSILWDPDGDQPPLTQADGSFDLAHLFPGVYTLETGGASSEGAADWAKLTRGGLEVVADRILEGIELRLKRSGKIAGVVHSPDGAPVAGAIVYVRDESGRILGGFPDLFEGMSDELGRFEYPGVGPGSYTVSARTRALVGADGAPVTVVEGDEVRTDIVVHPGTRLCISLEGQGASRVIPSYSIRDEKGREYEGLFGPVETSGLFSGESSNTARCYGPLSGGRYLIRATTLGGRTASGAITLDGEPERKIVLRLVD